MTLPRFICATELTRNMTGDLSSERRNPHFAKLRQLCGALALAAAGLVQANPVTYYFVGQLSAVDPVLTPSFAIGSHFSGSFTYESTTPDNTPLDPNRGFYPPGPAFTVTFNGITISHAVGGSGSVAVFNDLGGDRFSINANGSVTTGTVSGGYQFGGFHLYLYDITATALASDALPATELDLGLFGLAGIELSFFNPSALIDTTFVDGQLNYLSLTDPNTGSGIPEPGSLAMLALGLSALGYTTKRRRPLRSGDCQE